jgi:biopolymer transport protein ExbD
MNFRKDTEHKQVEVNLTPLIDVVFLLLIFFMVSTTFDKQAQIEIKLPEAESSEIADKDPEMISVGINAEGKYYVNNEELLKSDADTLKRMLIKAAKNKTDLPVVISADGKAPHQSVVTVLDVASQLGMTQMTFATRQSNNQADSATDD